MGHQAKVKAQRHLERAKEQIADAVQQRTAKPVKAEKSKPVERVLESHQGANRKQRRKMDAELKTHGGKPSTRSTQGRSVPKAEFDRLAAAKAKLQEEVAKWRSEAIRLSGIVKQYESGALPLAAH